MKPSIVWFALIQLFLSVSIFASEEMKSATLQMAADRANALRGKYGASQVLVVWDLDNTILKTDQDLGSEHWFDWESSLLPDPKNPKDPRKENPDPMRVACDFNDLLEIQRLILSMSKMSPTEPGASDIVSRLQKDGIANIILTSRGFGDTVHTVRELSRNGLDFSKTAIPPKEGFGGSYLPYSLEDITNSGITPKEVEKLKLGSPRPTTYLNGVYFTEGQHKGAMLKTLLKKTGTHYKAIVFIDNLDKHTKRMQDAMASGSDLTTIRYTGMDTVIESFGDARKQMAIKDYLALRSVLEKVFGYKRPCNDLPIDKVNTKKKKQEGAFFQHHLKREFAEEISSHRQMVRHALW